MRTLIALLALLQACVVAEPPIALKAEFAVADLCDEDAGAAADSGEDAGSDNAEDALQATLEGIFTADAIKLLLLPADATATAWPDRSGNANDQPACADAPTPTTGGFGGRPYVAFNGTSECYERTSGIAGMPSNIPLSTIVIFDPSGPSASKIMFDCSSGASGAIKPRIVYGSNAPRYQAFVKNDTNDDEVTGTTAVSGDVQSFLGWMSTGGDGSELCVEVDGANTTCANVAGSVSRNAVTACVIGARVGHIQWYVGNLYFIGVFSTNNVNDLHAGVAAVRAYMGL